MVAAARASRSPNPISLLLLFFSTEPEMEQVPAKVNGRKSRGKVVQGHGRRRPRGGRPSGRAGGRRSSPAAVAGGAEYLRRGVGNDGTTAADPPLLLYMRCGVGMKRARGRRPSPFLGGGLDPLPPPFLPNRRPSPRRRRGARPPPMRTQRQRRWQQRRRLRRKPPPLARWLGCGGVLAPRPPGRRSPPPRTHRGREPPLLTHRGGRRWPPPTTSRWWCT
jgi:hypothetical protein